MCCVKSKEVGVNLSILVHEPCILQYTVHSLGLGVVLYWLLREVNLSI